MHKFPHIYQAEAVAGPEGAVEIQSPGLKGIETTSPPEFGGPEGYWSPETLLVAAVADCFILTFRAIARASGLEWLDLDCEAEGKLEKDGKQVCFTAFHLRSTLRIPETARVEKARLLLEKAESNCLITNSMTARIQLDTNVETVGDSQVA
jgi:organic hydroperoxide reductase OsmC/OhrA